MEGKTSKFLAKFSEKLFEKWQNESQKDTFWNDTTFLHQIFEEAIVKLPQVPLKAHLQRDLTQHLQVLKELLEKKYATYRIENISSLSSSSRKQEEFLGFFNEEQIEKALASSDPKIRQEVALRLGLEEYTCDCLEPNLKKDHVKQIVYYTNEAYRIFIREYEEEQEKLRKVGYFLNNVWLCMDALIKTKWIQKPWDSENKQLAKEVETVREGLERIVQLDLMSKYYKNPSHLAARKNIFYRPQESPLFTSIKYDQVMAKVHAILACLVVYFPLTIHDEEEEEEEEEEDKSSSSSSSSSESSDDEEKQKQKKIKGKTSSYNKFRSKSLTPTIPKGMLPPRDSVNLASKVLSQVLLSFRTKYSSSNAYWLTQVLYYLHQLQIPTQYDQNALESEKKQKLVELLAQVYNLTFASLEWKQEEMKNSDCSTLLQAILTLRLSMDLFMRKQYKKSLPALTLAFSKLSSIKIPVAFLTWLRKIKKDSKTSSTLQHFATKFLKKQYQEDSSVSLLMSESMLSTELYEMILEKYQHQSKVNDSIVEEDQEERQKNVEQHTGPLFYVDDVGNADDNTNKNNKKNTQKKNHSTTTFNAYITDTKTEEELEAALFQLDTSDRETTNHTIQTTKAVEPPCTPTRTKKRTASMEDSNPEDTPTRITRSMRKKKLN
jgi:hypothetical protein